MGKKRHAKNIQWGRYMCAKKICKQKGGKSSYFQKKATSAMIVLFGMRFA